MSDSRTLRFGPYSVSYDNATKTYFPAHNDVEAFAKKDVVEYYKVVAKHILHHVESRPLTLRRYPDGVDASGFYMQEAQAYFPDWIDRVEARRNDGERYYHVAAQRAADLAYLASIGTIELHMWLSRADAPSAPDLVVFDLDPPEHGDDAAGFERVIEAAKDIRNMLESIGLAPYARLTGSKGMHVAAPLKPEAGFDVVRTFAGRAAELLAARRPERYTLSHRKADRGGRLYLDVLRNAQGQHIVAPYSLRATPEASVAVPVRWDEVTWELRPRQFTLRDIASRLSAVGDPWESIWRHKRGLSGPRKSLQRLRQEEGLSP